MDWAEACRTLGVPESATDAEIKEQYVYKAQLLHPDKNLDKPESIRKKAEAELALVNQAYSFVSNPNNNPYKVPPKLAVEPMGVRFKDVAIGEKKTMVLTIRNAGGPYTSIWIDNQPAPWCTVTGVKSITSERLPLEVALECQGSGQPGNQYSADLVIKLENEKTHVVDFATVKIELFTKAEPVKNTSVRKEATVSANKIKTPTPQPEPSPQTKPIPTPVPMHVNRGGFSFGALLLNLLAFAVLGGAAYYFVNSVFTFTEVTMMIGSIVYTAVAFGVSLNHAMNVGSGVERTKAKDKNP